MLCCMRTSERERSDKSYESNHEGRCTACRGTSLLVYPAAGLLNYYREDKLIIVNIGTTPFDSRARLVINDSAGKVMRTIADGLKS